MKILVGTLTTGRFSGGIDAYLMSFLESLKLQYPQVQVDFLTNKKDPELEKELKGFGSNLFETHSLKRPYRQYKDIRKIIRQNGYDVVYMNVSTAISFICAKAAKTEGVKKRIVHAHSSGYESTNPLRRRIIITLNYIFKPIIFHLATDYWACSKPAAIWVFSARALKAATYKVIPNAIDIKRFAFHAAMRDEKRKEFGLQNHLVIGHVGRFIHVKNHRFIIDVFHALHQLHKESKLMLVGDGELMEDIRARVSALNLDDDVIFLGQRNDIPDLLQAMDAFVFPSFFEGFGYAALEAEATGLKCFLSKAVPSEVDMTGNCFFLGIKSKDAPENWAKTILENALHYERKDRTQDIIDHGYGLGEIDFYNILFGDLG